MGEIGGGGKFEVKRHKNKSCFQATNLHLSLQNHSLIVLVPSNCHNSLKLFFTGIHCDMIGNYEEDCFLQKRAIMFVFAVLRFLDQ